MPVIEATSQLYSQAATLMLVGMGFVFAFLGLLIIAIKLIIAPLAVKYPDKPEITPIKNIKSPSNNDQTAIVAAISVAINQYRKKHK